MSYPNRPTREFFESLTFRKSAPMGFSEAGDAVGTESVSPGSASEQGRDRQKPHVRQEALRLLVLAAGHLPGRLTKLYERAGLSARKGRAAAKELCQEGLVIERSVQTGRRGGKLKILEPTDLAWDFLASKDFVRPEEPTKGGWLHNEVAAAVRRVEGTKRKRVHFEVKIGSVVLDAISLSDGGEPRHYQIGISNPEREVKAIARAIQVPVVRQKGVELIGIDKEFIRRVKTLLQADAFTKDQMSNITMSLAGGWITNAYKMECING